MPQVPYTPYPDVVAREEPMAGPRVELPDLGRIGEALERRLGPGLAQFGDDIFKSAMHQQTLLNDTAAREAQNNYAIESSKLQANYDALVGKEKVDAAPAHYKALSDLRIKLGAGLNQEARRKYDADSMPFMQRNIFSAAAQSARAAKEYKLGVDKANLTLELDASENDPDNDTINRAQSIGDRAAEIAKQQYGVTDDDDPIVKAARREATSHNIYRRASGYANRGDVEKAEEIKQQALKNKQLTPDDADKLDNRLQGVATNRYADMIVNGVIGRHRLPDGSMDATTLQIRQEAREEVDKHPDLPHLPSIVDGRILTQVQHEAVTRRMDDVEADRQLRETALKNDAHTVMELGQTVEGKKVIERYEVSKRSEFLQNKLNETWDAVGRASNQAMMNKVRAMARFGAVDDLMSINESDPKYGFSWKDQDEVNKLKAKALKDPSADPRTTKAMKILLSNYGHQLNDLGVAVRDPKSPDDYWNFRSLLTESLQAWQEDHKGAPPTEKDIKDEIGPRVINAQVATKGLFAFGRSEPAFKQWPSPTEVPIEFVKQRYEELARKGMPAPSEEELLQAYRRSEFNKLMKQSTQKANVAPAPKAGWEKPLKTTPTEPTGGGPTVPRSE